MLPINNTIRQISIAVIDLFLTGTALFLALLFRFGGDIPSLYFDHFEQGMWPVVVIHLAAFFVFGVYKRLWYFYTLRNYALLAGTVLVGAAVFFAYGFLFGTVLPRSVYLMYSAMLFGFAVMSRFVLRKVAEFDESRGEGGGGYGL